MFIERRRAKRIAKKLEVQYRDSASKGRWYLAEVKNLSEGGLLAILSAKGYEINAMLRFRIKLPENPSQWFEFDGRVVACNKDAPCAPFNYKANFYLLRIQIIKIELLAKDMIRQFVTSHLSSI